MLVPQRDTVRAASEFASRNHLPHHIEDQMLSHLCLRFKTEALKQQETLNGMPKAIRASIAHHLFFPVLQKVYLFQGVSHDFIFQLVTEMEAEYFPPKEDVMLQNESPTDLYVLVSGAVDLIRYVDGQDQVLKKAVAGETFGEIGVLCFRPQPFTVRTTELSQILRLSRTSLMNAMHANPKEAQVIMENLFMRSKGHGELGSEYLPTDPELVLHETPDRINTRGSSSHACTNSSLEKARLHNMIPEDGKRDLNAAAHKNHPDMVEVQLEREADDKNLNPIRWKQKALVDQQQNMSTSGIPMNLESGNTLDEHTIEFVEPEILDHARKDSARNKRKDALRTINFPLGKVYTNSYSSNSNHPTDRGEARFFNKRVTIHFVGKGRITSQEQHGKLIILPDSFEELLQIAGEKFGVYKPTKVVNTENAEIDDLSVIRDGDHLFFLSSDTENLSS